MLQLEYNDKEATGSIQWQRHFLNAYSSTGASKGMSKADTVAKRLLKAQRSKNIFEAIQLPKGFLKANSGRVVSMAHIDREASKAIQ